MQERKEPASSLGEHLVRLRQKLAWHTNIDAQAWRNRSKNHPSLQASLKRSSRLAKLHRAPGETSQRLSKIIKFPSHQTRMQRGRSPDEPFTCQARQCSLKCSVGRYFTVSRKEQRGITTMYSFKNIHLRGLLEF